MKLIKLTVLTSLLFSSILVFTSCEPDAEQKRVSDYSKTGIVLTGAQEAPVISPSTALGSMDVSYSRDTKILNYSLFWSGLAGPVTAMHLHGPAQAGYGTTVVLQTIIGSGGIFPAGAAYGITGKVSGTLLVDGVQINEEDLLNGRFFIHIHTAAYPSDPRGEIRGQIVFK